MGAEGLAACQSDVAPTPTPTHGARSGRFRPIEPVWRTGRATGDLSRALAGIEPAKHLSAHLEGRDYLLGHRDYRAATRIASGACAAPVVETKAEAADTWPRKG